MGAPLEIWLYGSVARADQNRCSDLDVLAVSDEHEFFGGDVVDFLGPVVRELPQSQHLSLSSYSWSSIEEMANYGSLFLLHIKLEGRILWPTSYESSRLRNVLDNLPPYQNASRDFLGFRAALADVEASLSDDGDLLFELATIASIIRHCSILGCYLFGAPAFDRFRSIRGAFSAVGMAHFAERALELYGFRLAHSRNIPTGFEMSFLLADNWRKIALDFVGRVEDASGY